MNKSFLALLKPRENPYPTLESRAVNKPPDKFWESLDLILKIIIPFLTAAVGWITAEIYNHNTRLARIESSYVTQRDFTASNKDLYALLSAIDAKVSAINSRLEESDRHKTSKD